MTEVTKSPDPQPAISSPSPTGMPLLAAAGIALAFTGLVTSLIVTVVGVILAATGFTGWFREVLPREHREEVPVEEPAEEILPERVAVTHLQVGEQGHRARLPLQVHPYSAGIKGGIAGGFVMAALAVVLSIVRHGSPW